MIKSVYEMSAAEIRAAQEAGQKTYGTTMATIRDGKEILSDIEDFSPFALRVLIAEMERRGWREVPNNRFHQLGMHPKAAAQAADIALTNAAFGR